ncbi:hypothetical protein [Filifactor alocis]|uniref:hypothetical protein n=1 Tax=Filifactor alocis TaxID=143361 RepID=UPI003F9FB51D
MSYFSILDFIKSGKKSLDDKNYWSALSVALTLPSMCSRIMFQDDKFRSSNKQNDDGYWYIDNKGIRHYYDKKCYIDCCKRLMANRHGFINGNFVIDEEEVENGKFGYDSVIISMLGSKFSEALYQLRCDIIHVGIANIYDDNKGIYLRIDDCNMTTELSDYRIISVFDLCDTIFHAVEMWCDRINAHNFKYTYVFDIMNNEDDRILYNKLCEDARAEYLKKKFLDQHNKQKNKG